MKIAIGGDHAGFQYKKEIINTLKGLGHEVKDFGPNSEDSVDYPDFAHPVSKSVNDKEFDFGILICGSGNGVAITANKYIKVRAALCWNEDLAKLARQHNNANILCLPSRFIGLDLAKQCVQSFLATPFEGGRHSTRVEKISNC
ncbi:MAG: ribose 5-phosphate isomerase B [Cytophagaceae bacterium]|nr:ribose 5-phosphate isomerase B [Cytophagaceae bacterium]